jgi:hypothetical protein
MINEELKMPNQPLLQRKEPLMRWFVLPRGLLNKQLLFI